MSAESRTHLPACHRRYDNDRPSLRGLQFHTREPVDSALNDFLPIRTRRAELGLSGNSGEPPSIFEMLLGDQKLIGPEANRIRTSLNKATGELDDRQTHHATDVVTPDGKKAREITLDERDKKSFESHSA